ncbi:hypothetical protein [Granulicella sp. L60]|uniref:hypothetical protein n=1 Tax=Granulicella sp. L60 TaxID=1641866 RepID=UPI00131C295B|nr:hypothetical protein [Granulicella sp. L60]
MKSLKIDSQPRSLSIIWILLFSFASIVFLYLRTFLLPATPFITLGDEAHYFLHALRMLHGQLPYRDFFTFIFPGTDLLYVGIFRLLGVHQWLVQGLLLVLGLLLSWIVLWISSRVIRGSSAILAALLFLVFDFNSALDATHHWWSTLFVMIAVGLLLGGRSQIRILAVGVLCGIATLFTQTHGGLSFLAFAFYLMWTNREDKRSSYLFHELLLLCVPFATVVTPVVGYYVHLVGLRTMTYWTIYFPVAFFHHVEGNTLITFFQVPPTHSVADLFSLIPYLFIHAIVPLIYLLCVFRLSRDKESIGQQQWRRILLLTFVGMALFISIMSAPTFLRLSAVSMPAMVLCIWFLDRSTDLYRHMRIILWAAAIISLVYLPISRQLHQHDIINLPTGRAAFITNKQCEKIWWLAQHTNPGETFFNDPTAAFALSLESPGPLDFVTTSEFTRPQQVDALLLSMTAHRTRYVFLYPALTKPALAKDNLGPFREYLAINYHLAKTVSDGQIWQRNGTVTKSMSSDYAPDRCSWI